MICTLFGSCRISKIHGSNNLNRLINYTHCTKEVLQFINFLKGNLEIPYPYNISCFRTAICNNIPIHYCKEFTDNFDRTDIFIIEICSSKKYIENNYYLHHLSVDKKRHWYHKTVNSILEKSTMETQTDEEIENDILEIQRLLHPKRIIIISHYNAKKDGKLLESRNKLICLLDKICKKHSIYFINPTVVLQSYNQCVILKDDLGHYTNKGITLFTDYMNKYCKTLDSKNVQ